jgi:Undecaprenyl-phosphate galactose phosphotransferase WbaP
MSTSYQGETSVGIESFGDLIAEPPPQLATKRVEVKADPVESSLMNLAPAPGAADWKAVVRRALVTVLPLVIADAAALLGSAAAVQLSMTLLFGGEHSIVSMATLALLPLIVAYWLSGLYSEIWLHSVLELRQLTHVSTVSLAAAAVGAMMTKVSSPLWHAFALLSVLFAVPISRRIVRRLCARYAWWGYSTLIIGSGEGADAAARTLIRARSSGLRPALMHDPEGGHHKSVRPVVNDIVALAERVRSEAIQHAVVSMPHVSSAKLAEIVDHYTGFVPHLLVLSHCSTLPALWGAARGCGGLSGIEVRNGLLLRTLQGFKRAADVLVAATTIILSLPVLLVIAAVIKLTSKGPVLFGHTRIGRHGKPFKAWKFRTMYKGADEILREHLDSDAAARAEWDQTQKLKHDPRVTAIGRLLRRTSLDELPQTWNVLVGDMSIVGPRPIITEEIRRYGEALRHYATVKPGITGLWQVSGRNDVSYQQRVQLDQFYIRHWSPWLDIHILAKTVVVLIKRKGAY